MNRFKLLATATCLLLLGHMSLAQQSTYDTERQARPASGQPLAPLVGQGNGYGQGNLYGHDDDRYHQSGTGYDTQYPTNKQGGYTNGYGNPYGNGQGGYGQNQPGYPRNYGAGGGYDRRSDVFRIERLDHIVDLTGYQKRDLFCLEQYYDRQFSLTPPTPGVYERLTWQKSQDVLAVLTPFQRDRLFAFEQYKAYNGYGSAYGRENGNGRGQRW